MREQREQEQEHEGSTEKAFASLTNQPQEPEPSRDATVCGCGHRESDHAFVSAPPDAPDPRYHGGGVCYGCARIGKAYMCGGFHAVGAA